LNSTAQKAHGSRGYPLLPDGLGPGLELVKDLQRALAIGRYCPGWHSIESRPEMLVGFGHAILFLQQLGWVRCNSQSNRVAD
jgi:hypothetical protein